MRKENPNGANATTSDPREQVCWDFYVKGIAEGKENAYAAAVKAGYTDKTARQITVRSWFLERKEALRRKDMLSKAERNLDEMLDLDVTDEIINPKLLAIKSDVSKTIAKTLGKKHYSERTEVTGADGKELTFTVVSYKDEHSDTAQI